MQPADRSHVDIPDEPTRGLHFADVHTLLEMLDRPVEQGNTVMVSGHNLDVIKTADRIIDLGPEGGEEGGALVAQGTPEQVAAKADSSYNGALPGGDRETGRAAEARSPAPEGGCGGVAVGRAGPQR